jgi:GNAT superfamily N-acetyltransferase
MASVLQLRRELIERPQVDAIEGVSVRSFAESDVENWLHLRHLAFARERVGVREWNQVDFVEEFSHRWWWRPDWMWLAEIGPGELVGSVTLAMRGEAGAAKPVVHWLMVRRDCRRKGIARLLMSHLEAAACDAGHREICLETHAGWDAAVRFYAARGYQQI